METLATVQPAHLLCIFAPSLGNSRILSEQISTAILRQSLENGKLINKHENFSTQKCSIKTYYFFAHVLISYGSAFFLSMAFESPVLSIERLIFKSNRVSETSGLSTSKTGGNDFGQRNGEGFQKKANGTLSVGNFISSLRSKLT